MKYNHLFDICFSVETSSEDPYSIPDDELFYALEQRLRDLRANPNEIQEACGYCDDTYEVEATK